MFAVAMMLKPTFANSIFSDSSSGIAITRSESAASSESWISSGQRVISSNRTSFPCFMPSYSGDGTSARCVGQGLRQALPGLPPF